MDSPQEPNELDGDFFDLKNLDYMIEQLPPRKFIPRLVSEIAERLALIRTGISLLQAHSKSDGTFLPDMRDEETLLDMQRKSEEIHRFLIIASRYAKLELRDWSPETQLRIVIIGCDHEEYKDIFRILDEEYNHPMAIHSPSGQAGVDICKRSNPEIILIDRNTPDMNNLELLKILRDELPESHIIMSSHGDEPGWMRQALILGANDFLSKPIDKEILLASLRYFHNL